MDKMVGLHDVLHIFSSLNHNRIHVFLRLIPPDQCIFSFLQNVYTIRNRHEIQITFRQIHYGTGKELEAIHALGFMKTVPSVYILFTERTVFMTP